MFKRSNKITALLVAAAAVVSLVPATTANAATRLGTKDGHIKNGAVAYDDGKYIYDGYRTEDDDTGIYYNNGTTTKEKLNDDLIDYEINYEDAKYGTKYVYSTDNNGRDQYLIDLSTGKIVDDETPEDKADEVKSRLRSKLKRTDRYANTGTWNSINLGDSFEDENYDHDSRILKGQFGEVWYKYSAKGDNDGEKEVAGVEASKATFYKTLVAGDDVGSEIAALKANKKITDVFKADSIKQSTSGASVTIVGTAKEEGKIDAAKITEIEKQNVKVINGNAEEHGTLEVPSEYYGFVNESGKYIDVSNVANMYVYSEKEHKAVKIKEYNKENRDYDITVALDEIKAIAQDKDYIYTLTTVKVKEGNSALRTQYFIQKISKAQGDKEDGAYVPKSVKSYQLDNKDIYDDGDMECAYKIIQEKEEDGFKKTHISVKNGTLYVTGTKADGDHDKVKVYKIALKKAKLDTTIDNEEDVDTYVAKKDGDTDIEIRKDTKDTAVAYDVDGNTWVISKGTITKINGTDKKKMYTCDRTFNHLDVYDDDSLVAWDADSDVYTTVQEGKKVTEDEATPKQVGWIKNSNGTWSFFDTSGTQIKHNWINSGGNYYYLNENGIMESGKWVCPFGNWYLLNADGTMANSGWVCPYGNWYYLNGNGNPLTGWQYINGSWYYMNGEGTMKTGWQYINGSWYYLQSSGAMKTGWLNDNGTWYYLNSSGAMLSNTTIGGYKLASNGAWIR